MSPESVRSLRYLAEASLQWFSPHSQFSNMSPTDNGLFEINSRRKWQLQKLQDPHDFGVCVRGSREAMRHLRDLKTGEPLNHPRFSVESAAGELEKKKTGSRNWSLSMVKPQEAEAGCALPTLRTIRILSLAGHSLIVGENQRKWNTNWVEQEQ